MSSRGVLFVATGQLHRAYAQQSVARIRELHPELSFMVYTDDVVPADWPSKVRFREITDTTQSLHDQITAIVNYTMNPAFSRTVYLDADTWVCDDEALPELFETLDTVPLAMAVDESRELSNIHPEFEADIPSTIPMPNIGVMPFRPVAVQDVFSAWHEQYSEHETTYEPGINEQPALRIALLESDCRWVTLPSEFNLRIKNVPQSYFGPPRIVHSMAANLSGVAAAVDQDAWQAVHPVSTSIPEDDHVLVLDGPSEWRMQFHAIREKIRNHGLVQIAVDLLGRQ